MLIITQMAFNMKWLVLIDKYIPEFVGGHVKYTERFAKELVKLGHKVTILTASCNPDLNTYEIIDGMEIHRVHVKKGFLGPLRLKNRNLFNEKLLSLLKENTYDVVDVQGFILTLNFLRTKRKKFRFKLLHTVHAPHFYEIIYNLTKSLSLGKLDLKELIKLPVKVPVTYLLEFCAIKYSDKTIVMSEYMKNLVKTFFGTRFLDKIHVSAIGVSDLTSLEKISKSLAREKLNLNSNDKIFITVRRLAPRMGLQNSIEAFSYMEDFSAKLIIIGEGELYNKLDKCIRDKNLQDRVILAGFIEDERLHYYYCAADCFILPTETLEGFGIVTIEALSYGLSVISTPKGASPEILNKFCPDLITKDHKAKSIYEKINYFLDNIEKFNQTNYAGKVREEYNWTKIIENIILLLNGIKQPKVLMIGSDPSVLGGMSSVISLYKKHGLFDGTVNYLTSHRSGSIFSKILHFAVFLVKYLFILAANKSLKIVHTHVSHKGSFFRKALIIEIAKILNKKVIFHIHGSEFDEFYKNSPVFVKKLITATLNKSDLIFVLSNQWAKAVGEKCSSEKIRIIYNPVEIIENNSDKLRETEQVNVLFMGKIGKRKGVYDIIEAARLINDLNVKINLYGDGEINEVRGIVSENHLDQKILVNDWINDRQKAYQESDIFILPSYNEGLPVSICEAMANALPVIATNTGGIPDQIEDGNNGFLIERGDYITLAEKIGILARNINLREKMGAEGYKIAKEKFDINVIIPQLKEAYDELYKIN